MSTHRSLRTAGIAVLATAAFVLAGCGSSGGDTKASSDGGKTTTTVAAASGDTTTSGADDGGSSMAKFGSNGDLVDDQGRTLYTLTKDGKNVDCTDACLGAWPPAPASDGFSATIGGVKLASTKIPSGTTTLTADGLPLYRFSGDQKAGDANGDGLASFGGTWKVVKQASDASGSGGATTTTTEAPTTTAGSSSGGGGYGY